MRSKKWFVRTLNSRVCIAFAATDPMARVTQHLDVCTLSMFEFDVAMDLILLVNERIPPTSSLLLRFPRLPIIPVQFDAWVNLRGDLDKVQMGVATPDQLRGTYAAANAPPPPPPPRGLPNVSEPTPRREHTSELPARDGRSGREARDKRNDGSERPVSRGGRASRRSRDDTKNESARDSGGRARRDATTSQSPPPPPPREGLRISVQLPITTGDEHGRADKGNRNRTADGGSSPSGIASGDRRRSSTNGKSSSRDGHRDRNRERDRERDRQKDRKRKRDRERDNYRGRERGATRSRERRGVEKIERDPPRKKEGNDGRERWNARAGR